MATAAETKAAADKKAAAEKKKKEETALAQAANTDLAPAALFETEAAEGFEGMTQDDLVVPFIKLLQKMSDEVDEDHGAFLEGASPGMFLDAATLELMEEVNFVVCHYHRAMVEWRDRDEGGGFVAQHPAGYELECEKQMVKGKWTGRWLTSDGTYLSDTRYFFGLRVDLKDSTAVPGVIAFSSTQIKKARSWMTRMNALTAVGADGQKFKLPIFASIWTLTSVAEENDQGSWKGYKIEQDGFIQDQELADLAKEARGMFASSASQFAHVESGGSTEEDEDLPF